MFYVVLLFPGFLYFNYIFRAHKSLVSLERSTFTSVVVVIDLTY